MIKKTVGIFSVFLLLLLFSSLVLAQDVYVVNSEDWVDVYSGMLYSGLDNSRGFFVNSDSITSLTQVISKDDTIYLFQSDISPFIPNLDRQLDSVGYDVVEEDIKSNLNLDLAPDVNTYYLVSLDNPRITSSLASLAMKERGWVFIVDVENVDEVVKKIQGADEVLAIGRFPRAVMTKIDPYIDTRISNNDIYKDSQELADRFEDASNFVVTDGAFIEAEFFLTKNPVLLSGSNKILGLTFDYLKERDAGAIILVGNELSVVGEQIREKSNKEISVFVKFGQGDTTNSGEVYALSTFPLPNQRLSLNAQQAIYDPLAKELIVTFKNTGNSGLYELTNLRVVTDDEEIATTADSDITFIAAGELLPVKFPMEIDLSLINENSMVEFYTSFGLLPSELDTFLTMENKFGPPFALPLTIREFDEDSSIIFIDDVSYYRNMNRVGITLTNPGDEDVYLTAKVHDLIISGVEETISKDGVIAAGETSKVYLNARLDEVDLEDNEEFDVVLNYGKDPEFQFKTLSVTQPFKIVSGGRITGFVTGLGNGSPGNWAVVIVVVVLLLIIIRLMSNKKRPEAKDIKSNKKVPVRKSRAKK